MANKMGVGVLLGIYEKTSERAETQLGGVLYVSLSLSSSLLLLRECDTVVAELPGVNWDLKS